MFRHRNKFLFEVNKPHCSPEVLNKTSARWGKQQLWVLIRWTPVLSGWTHLSASCLPSVLFRWNSHIWILWHFFWQQRWRLLLRCLGQGGLLDCGTTSSINTLETQTTHTSGCSHTPRQKAARSLQGQVVHQQLPPQISLSLCIFSCGVLFLPRSSLSSPGCAEQLQLKHQEELQLQELKVAEINKTGAFFADFYCCYLGQSHKMNTNSTFINSDNKDFLNASVIWNKSNVYSWRIVCNVQL